MQIFVMTMTGETITINIEQTDTIYDIKHKINEKKGWDIQKQQLILPTGITADNAQKIEEYDLKENVSIHLIINHSNSNND